MIRQAASLEEKTVKKPQSQGSSHTMLELLLLNLKCRARHARHFCPTEEKKRSRPYEDKNIIFVSTLLDACPTPARRLLSVFSLFSRPPIGRGEQEKAQSNRFVSPIWRKSRSFS